MFKKYKWLQKIFAVLTLFVFLSGISALTAYADPGDDGGVPVADDGGEVSGGDNNGGNVDVPDEGNADSGDSSQPVDSGSRENGNVDNGYDSGDNGGNNDGGEDDEPSTTAPISISEQINEIRNKYIDNNEGISDEESDYTPNKNLVNLPTVATEEVAAATAEPLPDVEVSDATLFSGIIMWVCVAVGISVVAGVMVSKRTHRRG